MTSSSTATATATATATVMTTFRRMQMLALHTTGSNMNDDNSSVSNIPYNSHDNDNDNDSFPTAEQQPYDRLENVVVNDEEELTFPWYYTLIFLFGFCVLLAVTWLIRTILIRFCGWDCLRGQQQQQQQQHHHHHYHHHHYPFYNTTGLGTGLGNAAQRSHQNQTRTIMEAACDDLRDMQIQKQRQERRIWYTYSLKSYTTVLTEQNFQINDLQGNDMNSDMTETEDKNTNGDSDMQQQDQQEQQQQREEEEEETDEIIMTEMEEGQSSKMMKLWDQHDKAYRLLEANCSICLLDYQINDAIVQSAANEETEYCRHVFHYDCMLLWLVQGKKRCPICRHWFVPAIRIKDQQRQNNNVTCNTLALSTPPTTPTTTQTPTTNTASTTTETDDNAGAHVHRNNSSSSSSSSSDASNGYNTNDNSVFLDNVAFSHTNIMERMDCGGEDHNDNNNDNDSHHDNDNDNHHDNDNDNHHDIVNDNDNAAAAVVRITIPECIEEDVLV